MGSRLTVLVGGPESKPPPLGRYRLVEKHSPVGGRPLPAALRGKEAKSNRLISREVDLTCRCFSSAVGDKEEAALETVNSSQRPGRAPSYEHRWSTSLSEPLQGPSEFSVSHRPTEARPPLSGEDFVWAPGSSETSGSWDGAEQPPVTPPAGSASRRLFSAHRLHMGALLRPACAHRSSPGPRAPASRDPHLPRGSGSDHTDHRLNREAGRLWGQLLNQWSPGARSTENGWKFCPCFLPFRFLTVGG